MSLNLIETNALFLHIPKTGGNWVEEALKACGIRVEYAKGIGGVTWRHQLRHQLTGSFRRSFAIVRHPLSWYESWWKFQAGIWHEFEPDVWHPQRVLGKCRSDDFSEFIRLCIEHEPAYVSRMYEWYIGPPGWECVDVIGRFEHLADDLVAFIRSLGYEFDEARLRGQPPANVSRKACGEPVWDRRLKQQVLALEAPALRRFYAGAASADDSASGLRHFMRLLRLPRRKTA